MLHKTILPCESFHGSGFGLRFAIFFFSFVLRMLNDVSRSQVNSHCFPPKEEKNRRKTNKTTSSENSQIYGHRLYKKSFSLIFVSFSPPDDVHRELFMTQMKVQHIASCDVFLLSDAKHCVPCQTSGCFRSTFLKTSAKRRRDSTGNKHEETANIPTSWCPTKVQRCPTTSLSPIWVKR